MKVTQTPINGWNNPVREHPQHRHKVVFMWLIIPEDSGPNNPVLIPHFFDLRYDFLFLTEK